jgi:proteasome accessory factor C
MSLGDRLARLLFIVPYVAKRDGVPLAELAERLGATPAEIEADLDILSMVGQPPLTPDHLIDIYIEDQVVYVHLDQSLSRPPGLTQEEARALVLGIQLAGQGESLGDELQRVLDKIVAQLNPVDAAALRSLRKRVGVSHERQAGGFGAALRRAIEQQTELGVEYYSASSDRHKTYRLQPLALISHRGDEYLVALDVDAQSQEKLFRLDRMGGVELMTSRFERPAELDLERFRTDSLYTVVSGDAALVRFSPQVASQVAELFARGELRREPDGAVIAEVSTSSPAWLARWVLPFGLDAEVLEPAGARRHLADLCDEACRAYAREP